MRIKVGWINRELGELECEVLTLFQDGTPRLVQWAKGRRSRVTYLQSQNRYVWTPRFNTPSCMHPRVVRPA